MKENQFTEELDEKDKIITVPCTWNQLRQFARGEIYFGELVGREGSEPGYWEYDLQTEESYLMNLDDLKAALQWVLQDNHTLDEFYFEWLEPLLSEHGFNLGLPQLVGHPDMEDIDDIWQYELHEFPKTEQQLAFNIFLSLDTDKDNYCAFMKNDDFFILQIKDYIQRIENQPWNQKHPLEEWKFTTTERKEFVDKHHHKKELATLGKTKQKLFRQFLEELCAEGDLQCIRIKGYACYGDKHPVYACDWDMARDCMLTLAEKGNDEQQAQAANTLGYIYYYGRCNGFVPEYDKAYQYFSMASFYGMHEATYKIGDMLANGYGVMKNPTSAYHCYYKVYIDCYQKFQSGNKKHVLADAALRMARAYKEGIGVQKNPMLAYHYGLQAQTAMIIRKKHENFYGIEKVEKNIEILLGEIRDELEHNEHTFHEENPLIDPRPLIETLGWGKHQMELTVTTRENCHELQFKRKRLEHHDPAPKVLITVAMASYSEGTDTIRFTCAKDVDIHLHNDASTVTYDSVEIADDALKFYKGHKKMAQVTYVKMYFQKPLISKELWLQG